MTRPSAAVVGMGQLGRVVGEALLCDGWTVTGFKRSNQDYSSFDPSLAVIATGEDDLSPVLSALPNSWLGRLVLLQNELLPSSWLMHGVENPTVFVVWFSKKAGQVVREYRPSLIFGPVAHEIQSAMNQVGVSTEILSGNEDLVEALLLKNTYIWSQNIVSLAVDDPRAERVLTNDRNILSEIIRETLEVQKSIVGSSVDVRSIEEQVLEVISRDGDKKLGGRSAAARLRRLLTLADTEQVLVPTIKSIAQRVGVDS